MNLAPIYFLHLLKSHYYSKERPESFNLKVGIIQHNVYIIESL